MLPIWHQRPVSYRKRAQHVQDRRSNSSSVTAAEGRRCRLHRCLRPCLSSAWTLFHLLLCLEHMERSSLPACLLGFVPSIHFIILWFWPGKQNKSALLVFTPACPQLPTEVHTHRNKESGNWRKRKARWNELINSPFLFSVCISETGPGQLICELYSPWTDFEPELGRKFSLQKPLEERRAAPLNLLPELDKLIFSVWEFVLWFLVGIKLDVMSCAVSDSNFACW